LNIWYTNADTLTKEKLHELKEDIKSDTPPDIIAITELKPKNYKRELTNVEYKIKGYRFEPKKLDDKGSTRGVALYIRESLNCSEIKINKIMHKDELAPSELICFEIKLHNNEKMFFSNVYRSPNSKQVGNYSINTFFRNIGNLKYKHKIIVGDFNRKDIDWDTVTSTSEDDRKFIEATRDSFLTQHISTPTRGRGTNEPTLIDLVFASNEECIENINISPPLGKSDHSMIKILYRSQPEIMPTKSFVTIRKLILQR
jgi:hypothetical protein